MDFDPAFGFDLLHARRTQSHRTDPGLYLAQGRHFRPDRPLRLAIAKDAPRSAASVPHTLQRGRLGLFGDCSAYHQRGRFDCSDVFER